MKRIISLIAINLCLIVSISHAQKLYVGSGVSFTTSSEGYGEAVQPALYVEFEGNISLKHKWSIGLDWWKAKANTYTYALDEDIDGISVDCFFCPDGVSTDLNFFNIVPSYRYEYNTAGAFDIGWAIAIPVSAKVNYSQPTYTLENEGSFNEHYEGGAPYTDTTEQRVDQFGIYSGPSFTFSYKFNRIYLGLNATYLFGKLPVDPLLNSSGEEEHGYQRYQIKLGYRLL